MISRIAAAKFKHLFRRELHPVMKQRSQLGPRDKLLAALPAAAGHWV
jgi:hypothetical protein